MATHHRDESEPDSAKRKNVAFSTVEGIMLGVGVTVVATVGAEMLYSFFKTRKLTIPEPERLAELIKSPSVINRLSLLTPLALGIGGAHGYHTARRHNRKSETFAERHQTSHAYERGRA